MKLNRLDIQKVQHQIFKTMENHFDKLIKIVESCETPNQMNVRFINWAFRALEHMKTLFNDEEYDKKVRTLAKTIQNRSIEVYAQTNHISRTGSIG
jgi:uncharacterized protein (DUF1330 family)